MWARTESREGCMTKETPRPPAVRRWLLGLAAAVIAAELVWLALYLRPERRAAPAPEANEPAVSDIRPRPRSYPANEPPAVAAGDPASPPAAAVAVADADDAGPVLCGGKVCKDDQFCCGPPACGHCASKLTGPECPTKCQ
jgi:hypothetical protein